MSKAKGGAPGAHSGSSQGGAEPPRCSFCRDAVKPDRALSGEEGAVICLDCLSRGKQILEQRSVLKRGAASYLERLEKNLLTPRALHGILNHYVIGQDAAKRTLAVAVYLHYRRMLAKFAGDVEKAEEGKAAASDLGEIEIDKSNVLLLGPTGSGKTLLAVTLARILEVPFAIADATTLTESGYVGDDVENILLRLLQNANFDVAWAEKGIIFIDELDKIGRKSESTSITRDVSGEGVQQALLKIIEGTVASVPMQGGRKHPQAQTVLMRTHDILFITGGAFGGLSEIIARREGLGVLGFTTGEDATRDVKERHKIFSRTKPEDLVRYGLIPELIGRLPVVAALEELDEAELKRVLVEPRNALVKQFEKLLALDGIALEIGDDYLAEVASEAKRLQTGARSLRSILERTMEEIFYEAPERSGSRVVITCETRKTHQFFSKIPEKNKKKQ